jgi:hypothetical protein
MNNYVSLPYFKLAPALKWAKENCPTYITNTFNMAAYTTFDENYIDFFFEDNEQGRQEMTMFALRWL